MKIKETATSLKTQVIQMIKKEFPNLSFKEDLWKITIHRKGFFEFFHESKEAGLKIKIETTEKEFSTYTFKYEGKLLFYEGEWMDVDIIVFDARYLDTAIKIGQRYERLSRKNATVIKKF